VFGLNAELQVKNKQSVRLLMIVLHLEILRDDKVIQWFLGDIT
jgi:hypothetical protein